MSYRLCRISVGSVALALLVAGPAVEAKKPSINRSVDSVHQPVVDRTDFVLDLAASRNGLAPGEADRLTGWFDGLRMGYGDTVTIDDPMNWNSGPARDAIGAVVARYGMLVAHQPAPITAGRPQPGSIRVVVSRAVAHVEGCPDWSRGNAGEYASSSQSNYGCATASNLAAMIANPQDLIEGRADDRTSDAMTSVKAIKAYRDATVTGAGGTVVKQVSSKSGGN